MIAAAHILEVLSRYKIIPVRTVGSYVLALAMRFVLRVHMAMYNSPTHSAAWVSPTKRDEKRLCMSDRAQGINGMAVPAIP